MVKVEPALRKWESVAGAVTSHKVDEEAPLLVRNKTGTLVGKLEQSRNPTRGDYYILAKLKVLNFLR